MFFFSSVIILVQYSSISWCVKYGKLKNEKKIKISIFFFKIVFLLDNSFFFCFVYILVFFNGLYSFSFLCQVDTRSMLFVLCDNVKDYELKEKYGSNCSRRGCKKNNCGSISSYCKFKKNTINMLLILRCMPLKVMKVSFVFNVWNFKQQTNKYIFFFKIKQPITYDILLR